MTGTTADLTHEPLHLGKGDHLCLFYDQDPTEQLPALISFVREGLEQNEQFVHVADGHSAAQLKIRLEQNGIPVEEEIERGRVKLVTRAEGHQPGLLNSEKKACQVRQLIHHAEVAGFAGVRFVLEVAWIVGPDISVSQLEQWEAVIRILLDSEFPTRIVCQYNRSRLSSDGILAALQAHPFTAAGGKVCSNPFYRTPLALNREKASAGAAVAEKAPRTTGQLQPARPAQRAREAIIQRVIESLDPTGRSEAEKALARERELLQAILNVVPVMIILYEPGARQWRLNGEFHRLTGWSSDELTGTSWLEKCCPDPLLQAEFLHFLESRSVGWKDIRLRTPDGHEIDTAWTNARVSGGTRVGIGIDKRAERARRWLAAIVESSDDAIISKDLNGIISSWNEGARRIFGYTAEEIIGKPVSTLIPLDRQDEEPRILSRIRRGERVDHYDTVRQRKDGTLVHISLTVSPVKDGEGRIVGASKIARDISDRKRSERRQQALYELAASVNRAAALPEIFDPALNTICTCHETSRAAILLQEKDGIPRFSAWRGLSEVYRQAVEGRPLWPPGVAPQPICVNDVAQATLEHPFPEALLREGIRAAAFIPLLFENRLVGRFAFYCAAPRQFTPDEIKLAETIAAQVSFAVMRQKVGEELEQLVNARTASLREAIAQMEEFSYTVSHDLRAPLRAMQGYAKAVIEDYSQRLDPVGRKYLERIVRGSNRMDRLIQDVLTYSRLSRREINLHPVSLDKLVHEIVEQYPEMQAWQKQIVIAKPLAGVIGHEPSLTQAISNLLNNALKFVPAGKVPEVRLWTELRGRQVRLWVQDNGIGIHPDHQHRLFGLFERIHPQWEFEGTGIGLAIVRKAVERMGGTVGVESDGVTGSRFWIQLAAAD